VTALIRNKVLLLLALGAILGLAEMGFVSEAPNRLLTGRAVALWNATDPFATATIAVALLALLAASARPPNPRLHRLVAILAGVVTVLLAGAAGAAARILAANGTGDERIALGGGFWIAEFCTVLAMVDAMHRLRTKPLARALAAPIVIGALAFLTDAGAFNALSIAREYMAHRDSFASELGRHLTLVLGSLAPALVIGIPLGVAALRWRRLRDPLFAALNLVQTIPSIALFALLIPPLALLAAAVPALAALGVHGIGATPALIALTLYALLPIARNTHAGLIGVDHSLIDSARAMGMSPAQIFFRVEVPLASPVLIAGLRIVTVQGIGLAVVAALIGAGGLGSFVFQGIGQGATDLVLLGALPAIAMALAADVALRLAAEVARRKVAR